MNKILNFFNFSVKAVSPDDVIETLLSSADKLKQHFETRVNFVPIFLNKIIKSFISRLLSLEQLNNVQVLYIIISKNMSMDLMHVLNKPDKVDHFLLNIHIF